MEGGQWRDVHGDHHPSINHVHACMHAKDQQTFKRFQKHFQCTGMQVQACKCSSVSTGWIYTGIWSIHEHLEGGACM